MTSERENASSDLFRVEAAASIPVIEPLKTRSEMWTALEQELVTMKVGQVKKLVYPYDLIEITQQRRWAEKASGMLRILRVRMFEQKGMQFKTALRQNICYIERLPDSSENKSINMRDFPRKTSIEAQEKISLIKAMFAILNQIKERSVPIAKIVEILSYQGLKESDSINVIDQLEEAGLVKSTTQGQLLLQI